MRKLFVLMLVLSMLMTSCGRVEVISTGTTSPTDSEPSTIPTIAEDITETEIISDSNDQTEEPDITTEITTEDTTTDDITTEITTEDAKINDSEWKEEYMNYINSISDADSFQLVYIQKTMVQLE